MERLFTYTMLPILLPSDFISEVYVVATDNMF